MNNPEYCFATFDSVGPRGIPERYMCGTLDAMAGANAITNLTASVRKSDRASSCFCHVNDYNLKYVGDYTIDLPRQAWLQL
jgi:hypothetical protein